MTVIETAIQDLVIIEPTIHGDNRGYFLETYNARDYSQHGLTMTFVQDNESSSKRGVLRGLHFQTANAQGKLVRVVKGEIFDVAVDLRKDSATFGQWESVMLCENNKKLFYIPEGFAHGFVVTSDTAVVQYKCTNYYSPQFESGIIWNDPTLNIPWPIFNVCLSEKDKHHQTFNEFISS
ncbi:MAG: dTDP-4-dehydrorhamnose 3,5-epimerase [Epulopiscium sp. Nuni2H_MBin001]|nr:MAG: dTDP-4-dehydrorhamnose 3,5-epimerase [Epulopiscium sp. Nuni2H_MBin001]